MKFTQTTGPTLGGQKPKGRKNSTFFKERIQLSLSRGKEDFKHNKLKKYNRKTEKYCTNERSARNTEVQISEEEIGKLPLKNQNNDSKDDQKP